MAASGAGSPTAGGSLSNSTIALPQPSSRVALKDSADPSKLTAIIKTQFDLELLLKRTECRTVRERRVETERLLSTLRAVILQRTIPATPLAAGQHRDGGVLYSMTRDGHFLRWRCSTCGLDSFASVSAFRQHCRVAHRLSFTGQTDLLRHGTVSVPESDVPADDPCRADPLTDVYEDVAFGQPDAAGMLVDELAQARQELRKRPSIKVYEEDVEMDDMQPPTPSLPALHTRDDMDTNADDALPRIVKGSDDMDTDTPTNEPAESSETTGETKADAATAPSATSNERRDNPEVTHKWTVFVDSENGEDISTFVRKVRFFLHPSFAPNDVIEVDSPPFAISRRGWGVFPIRVQLHVGVERTSRTKPVDIIHVLHLERSVEQVVNCRTYDIEVERSLPKRHVRTFTMRSKSEAGASSEADTAPLSAPARPPSPVLSYETTSDPVAPAIKLEPGHAMNEIKEEPVAAHVIMSPPPPPIAAAPVSISPTTKRLFEDAFPIKHLSMREVVATQVGLRWHAFCHYCGGSHLTRVCHHRPEVLAKARPATQRGVLTQLISTATVPTGDLAACLAEAPHHELESTASANGTTTAKRAHEDEDDDVDVDIEADDDTLSVGSSSRRGSVSVPVSAQFGAANALRIQSNGGHEPEEEEEDLDDEMREERRMRVLWLQQVLSMGASGHWKVDHSAATALLATMTTMARRVLHAAAADAVALPAGDVASVPRPLRVVVPRHVHTALRSDPLLDFLTHQHCQGSG